MTVVTVRRVISKRCLTLLRFAFLDLVLRLAQSSSIDTGLANAWNVHINLGGLRMQHGTAVTMPFTSTNMNTASGSLAGKPAMY